MKLLDVHAREYLSSVGWEEKEVIYHHRLLAGKGNSAEVGVANGGSLAYIAAAQQEFERGKTYAISPWEPRYRDIIMNWVPIEHLWNEWNIKTPDLTEWIEVIPNASFDLTVEQMKAMQPLVFVFIDAWHDGDAPYQDTLIFAPYVEVGGYIIYHDWGWGNGEPFLFDWVEKAFKEIRDSGTQDWEVKQHPMWMNLGIAKRLR